MPIALDYNGELHLTSDEEKADMNVIIDGSLDGTEATGPMVALSIPDKAYLGWINEMIPPLEDQQGIRIHWKRSRISSGGLANARQSVWEVKGQRRERAEVKDWEELTQRMHDMYREQRPGSVLFFEEVLDWYIEGVEAVRTLRNDGGDDKDEDEVEDNTNLL